MIEAHRLIDADNKSVLSISVHLFILKLINIPYHMKLTLYSFYETLYTLHILYDVLSQIMLLSELQLLLIHKLIHYMCLKQIDYHLS